MPVIRPADFKLVFILDLRLEKTGDVFDIGNEHTAMPVPSGEKMFRVFMVVSFCFSVWLCRAWHPLPVMRKVGGGFYDFREGREGPAGSALWITARRFA
jgi:hypothetical protein